MNEKWLNEALNTLLKLDDAWTVLGDTEKRLQVQYAIEEVSNSLNNKEWE